MSRLTSSTVLPFSFAVNSVLLFRRSVQKRPGSRLLIVTLCATVARARPATKPVRPLLAPFESASSAIGAFTALEVMLTMRPKRRAIMPSTVALISSIGVIMLAPTAFSQSSRENLRKSPGGGPPALVTRMSGSGQAASAAMRPCSLVMSAATVTTVAPVMARISSAVFSSAWRSRAMRVTRQPSRASEVAQPRPRPLLPPHTSAALPRIFRSTVGLPEKSSRRPQRNQHHAAQHQRATRQLYRGHGLVQSHPAEKNGGHRTERADQGNLVCADTAQRLRGDEYREHRRKNRHGDRYAVYGRRQRERRERPEQKELRDAKNARDRHGVGGETDRADPLHHLAAGHEVDGVACRTREAQRRAQRQVRVALPEQGRHHQRNPRVGDSECHDLADARALVQKNYRQRDDQRGIQEQDQAAQSRRDVLQAQKIDEAREVIPDEPQKDDRPDVAAGEPVAGRVASHPGCGREKEGQREDHPQREAHHARDRHRDADGAVGSRESHREDSVMERFVLALREERIKL